MEKLLDNIFVKIISKIIEIVVFGILFCYLAVIILQRTTASASVSGYRIFNVASGSMDPFIKVGDVILVKDADPFSLNVNDDVITYKLTIDGDEKLITHRFMRYEYDEDGTVKIVTKGDANAVEDNPIDPSQVLGRYLRTLTVVTFLTRVIRSKLGFFIFIFVPIVIYATIVILEDHYAKKDEEKEELEEKKKNEKVQEEVRHVEAPKIDRFGEEEESHLKDVPDETREIQVSEPQPVVIDDDVELKPMDNESVGDNSNE